MDQAGKCVTGDVFWANWDPVHDNIQAPLALSEKIESPEEPLPWQAAWQIFASERWLILQPLTASS